MRWAKKLPFTCSTLQKQFRNDVSQGVNVANPYLHVGSIQALRLTPYRKYQKFTYIFQLDFVSCNHRAKCMFPICKEFCFPFQSRLYQALSCSMLQKPINFQLCGTSKESLLLSAALHADLQLHQRAWSVKMEFVT